MSCNPFAIATSKITDHRSPCRLNKAAQPKSWELRFTWQTFWGLQAWKAASQLTLRDRSKEARVEPGYIGVLQQRADSWNIKKLLLIKENQTSQAKEFSAFLCMGRCKSLGSLQSFLRCAPQLPGARSLFFPILSPLRGTACGGLRWLRSWWLHHPLFADMAGNVFHPQP